MKCSVIQERIDLFVFEDNEQARKEIMDHIEACPSCRAHYDQSMQARAVLSSISTHQPVLSDPEGLTESILNTIQDPGDLIPEPDPNNAIVRSLPMIEKILLAASIALLVVFGYEQYIVVDKVLQLEQKMSDTQYRQSHIRAYQKFMNAYRVQSVDFIELKNESHLFSKKKNKRWASLSMAGPGVAGPQSDRSLQHGKAGSIDGEADKRSIEDTLKTN